MMDEGLLAAVYAHPDDHAPRLVLADWLDEHGGEWGQQQAAILGRPGRWRLCSEPCRRRISLTWVADDGNAVQLPDAVALLGCDQPECGRDVYLLLERSAGRWLCEEHRHSRRPRRG